MTNEIDLIGLKMTHFTILDAELYCKILNINPDNIIKIWLSNNKLKDINGVNIFKNLERLGLNDNKLNCLKNLEDLNNLQYLSLAHNPVNDISFLKNLVNLDFLYLNNTEIKDLNNLKNLGNLKLLSINNLNLTDESDAVSILKCLNNLKHLWCLDNTFKTVDIKKELSEIIQFY